MTDASRSTGPLSSDSAAESDTAKNAPIQVVEIRLPGPHDDRPLPVSYLSMPSGQSPIRHHRRVPSRSTGVKETLDARSHYGSSDDDGAAVHRINQYIIKQEIGRGSFGSVHLAEDQFGTEYAVKEFSKSRLRKRAQSNLLRKPNMSRRPVHHPTAAGGGFNSPLHRLSSSDRRHPPESNNSLSLIKEEIAIMKKLSHNNLVALVEVLDDPQEDSLYMVLEMCKKGVVMKVGLEEHAEPYPDETCRCWFRDMILGVEYLHATGIIHRDIKPDNCLITDDDVLKIVDFGVSEMFQKASDMATAKSAGSPAFMPPELCIARHGSVSGRAADIWSMGVTLYCLRYGRIPFEQDNIMDLYESIRTMEPDLGEEQDPHFRDLMQRLLEKSPEKRITMAELREHPWVTKDGTDPLLSADENCADIVEPPTEAEMDHAITGNMANLMIVMKAVKRFKNATRRRHGRVVEGLFGKDSRIVSPPHEMRHSKSHGPSFRRPFEKFLATQGLHRDYSTDDEVMRDMRSVELADAPEIDVYTDYDTITQAIDVSEAVRKQQLETPRHSPQLSGDNLAPETPTRRALGVDETAKGHARDPLQDIVYVNVGPDPQADPADRPDDADRHLVSESPAPVDMDIYEAAYKAEMARILARRGVDQPSMYMTRLIDHRDEIRLHATIKDAGKWAARSAVKKWDELYARGGERGRDLLTGVHGASDYAARVAAHTVAQHLSPSGDPPAPPADPAAPPSPRPAYKIASDKLAQWSVDRTGFSPTDSLASLVDRARAVAVSSSLVAPAPAPGLHLHRGSLRPPPPDRASSSSSSSSSRPQARDASLACPPPPPPRPPRVEPPAEPGPGRSP